jgi:hypothetical protein
MATLLAVEGYVGVQLCTEYEYSQIATRAQGSSGYNFLRCTASDVVAKRGGTVVKLLYCVRSSSSHTAMRHPPPPAECGWSQAKSHAPAAGIAPGMAARSACNCTFPSPWPSKSLGNDNPQTTKSPRFLPHRISSSTKHSSRTADSHGFQIPDLSTIVRLLRCRASAADPRISRVCPAIERTPLKALAQLKPDGIATSSALLQHHRSVPHKQHIAILA